MSIFAYVGLPRSGKSYGVVANTIIPALKACRTVCTNIPLYEERIRETVTTGRILEFPIQTVAAEPDRIEEFAPKGCVLILDEVWRLFPAGQKANQVPEPFRRLLAEHGHLVDEAGNAMSIVLVTQDLAQIGAFARQLVEQTFLHTKLGHLSMPGSYRVRIFHGPQTGQNPPKGSEINMTVGRYSKAVYRLYKSHTLSDSATDGANEKSADTRGNIWRRWQVWAGGVALVAVLVFVIPRVSHVFGGKEDGKPNSGASGATARNGLAASPRAAAAPARQGSLFGSGNDSAAAVWRITGSIGKEEGGVTIFVGNGVAYGSVSANRSCERDLDGELLCRFRGLVVSRFGEQGRDAPGQPLVALNPELGGTPIHAPGSEGE